MKIRTRIAPSPTGMLHIGTARTALFNYLFAKKNGGDFLVRIEDTDIARNSKESYDAIFQGLSWLGLNADETPEHQSKRGKLYQQKIEELLQSGKAYRSYILPEEIEKRKKEAERNGGRYLHRHSKEDEIQVDDILPVVRLKVEEDLLIVIEDAVQGRVEINSSTVEDFILARADGTPVYMLAVVCDDIDMKISHVIRGDDHLTNTAKQVLLFEAFGVNLPVFAHIPLIHGEDGAKLSKRHGALGVMEYQKMGYLPEAVLSYLLRLGWSNGIDDILSLKEATSAFSIEEVGRSPSRFDFAKLQNINEHFIKNTETERLQVILQKEYSVDFDNFINPKGAVELLKSRSKTLLELKNQLNYFKTDFENTLPVEEEKVEAIQEFMLKAKNQDIHQEFKNFLQEEGLKFKDLGPTFRILLIGTPSSIGIFEIIGVLGFAEAKLRIFGC